MSARGHGAVITYERDHFNQYQRYIRHLSIHINDAIVNKNIFRNGEKCWQNYDNDR